MRSNVTLKSHHPKRYSVVLFDSVHCVIFRMSIHSLTNQVTFIQSATNNTTFLPLALIHALSNSGYSYIQLFAFQTTLCVTLFHIVLWTICIERVYQYKWFKGQHIPELRHMLDNGYSCENASLITLHNRTQAT